MYILHMKNNRKLVSFTLSLESIEMLNNLPSNISKSRYIENLILSNAKLNSTGTNSIEIMNALTKIITNGK